MFHPYLKKCKYPMSVEAKRTIFDEFMNLRGSGCCVTEKNREEKEEIMKTIYKESELQC